MPLLTDRFDCPRLLRQGWRMTIAASLLSDRQLPEPQPIYQGQCLLGADDVPLWTERAIPPNPRGTLIATYGITGSLTNQGFLQRWATTAYQSGLAVLLFDWRAHGRSLEFSPVLTSDGLREGHDFLALAAQARQLGLPEPYIFGGYSLGGQLALWGAWRGLQEGYPPAAVLSLCPNLDAERSLPWLRSTKLGRWIEQRICREMRHLAIEIADRHPGSIDPAAIAKVTTIQSFDDYLVAPRLGFRDSTDYYRASSPLPFLADLQVPGLVLYAADDPFFHPAIAPELDAIAQHNPVLDFEITRHGGHVGYWQGRNRWWAIDRFQGWLEDSGTLNQR
ncbi:YheT family hydrolase [Synechococcus elongatus]|uniref:Alpha/beta fold hydrolase n=1 Tax=Synechococcus elongatus PCC 11802 TaxID=2283154 RepID=A0AAT9K6S5_SYNEL